MCGIIGITGRSTVTQRLVDGLKRLEYRGYDSSGIAVLDGGTLKRTRAKGKIKKLEKKLNAAPMNGEAGIAHTRWATHGEPNETNAHPHVAGRVGVVHNGIFENYLEIRSDLSGAREFVTDTDTEVFAHIMDEALTSGLSAKQAFSSSLKKVRGAYALGVIVDENPDTLYAARAGSPLAIGVGNGENYIGSDAMALAQLTQEIIYLEEGDWAVITPETYEIFDEFNNPVTRDVTKITGVAAMADKGNYEHFMLKEIYEQPQTIARTLGQYINKTDMEPSVPDRLDFTEIDRVIIIACGTASYAGEVAKYWFEQVAGIATDVDIASEFRYRKPVLSKNSLFIAVSQSGETADTLAALRYCKKAGLQTAALVNVMTSTMAREADMALPIHAGPEIGVASTKAFTSQLTALAALVLMAGRARGILSKEDMQKRAREMFKLPRLITDVLANEDLIKSVAKRVSLAKDAFFLARGHNVPIAFEGALKLKEISYIHAEGYAAGELKHGPIALIEDGTPVIFIAPHDALFEKTISNLQEVAARGAYIILVTDEAGAKAANDMADSVLIVPDFYDFISPILMSVPMQLLAYHAALHLGTDVDQPRNLAKSVTVE